MACVRGVVVLVCLCGLPLRADMHEVVKTTAAGREIVTEQYTSGNDLRFGKISGSGRDGRITIWKGAGHPGYELDPEAQEYAEIRPQSSDWILNLAQMLARPPRIRNSGSTVNVYSETIDTGERRMFFGHEAKHLKMRTRYVASPGACQKSREAERDGWYMPWPVQPGTKRGVIYTALTLNATASAPGCIDRVVPHGSPVPPGLAVLETDGPVTREIVEFSNEPLDKSIFEIPPGFKRVDSLPGDRIVTWSERLESDWNQLAWAFQSWFE